MSKPVCDLSQTDGNVFFLSGAVSRCLKRAGLSDQAKEFSERLWKCKDYDEALVLMLEYVEVE